MNKKYALLMLSICTLVVIGLLLSHLALTDIYRGVEPNLETEWWIVRITFILVLILVGSAITVAFRTLRKPPV
jgi:hypothetical protein